MATTMRTLADRVARALGDPTNETWTLADDLYPALTEADYAIIHARPDVNATIRTITTVAGTQQSITDGDFRLIDVRCNLNSDGTESEDIRIMQKQNLSPDWRTQEAVDEAEGYLFDDRTPTLFEVYPAIKAGRKLRIVTSAPFASYGTIDDTTESQLLEIYDLPKVEFALYRCYSKDNSPHRERAIQHLEAFQSILGIKSRRDEVASPKQKHQET